MHPMKGHSIKDYFSMLVVHVNDHLELSDTQASARQLQVHEYMNHGYWFSMEKQVRAASDDFHQFCV